MIKLLLKHKENENIIETWKNYIVYFIKNIINLIGGNAMGNSTIWIIVISMIIGGYFLEKLLRRKLNTPKGNVWIYKHVNSLHVKLEIGLFIVYLILSFIYLFKAENANIGIVVLIYFGAISLLRVWMEWKYNRETKEYILSIIGFFAFVFMVSMLFYFDPLSTY